MVVPPSKTVRRRANQWLRAFRWSLALLALVALAAAAESLFHDRYPRTANLFLPLRLVPVVPTATETPNGS